MRVGSLPLTLRKALPLAALMIFIIFLPASGVRGANESLTYVGSTAVSSTLSVEDGASPAGPYLASATFPDGANSAAYGVLLNAYCNNPSWKGSTDYGSSCTPGGTTGTKSCSGNACAVGPNDDDYCYESSLGAWNCGVPGSTPEPGYSASGASEAYASQWTGGTDCSNTATLPTAEAQSGAAVSIDNNDPSVLAPFNPCDVASDILPSTASPAIQLDISPIPASSYGLVLYLNNASPATETGCFQVTADGSASDTRRIQLATDSGALVEWSVANGPSSSSTAVSESSSGPSCSTIGNVDVSGFFIVSSGTPTAAAFAELTTSVAHGYTTMRWQSTRPVAGFNVLSKSRRLNTHLVTSKTARYHFRVKGSIRHPVLMAVQQTGR